MFVIGELAGETVEIMCPTRADVEDAKDMLDEWWEVRDMFGGLLERS